MPLPPEWSDTALKCLLAGIGTAWAIWNFMHTSARDRVRLTVDLFAKYNSTEMIEHRANAWGFIHYRNQSDAPFCYSQTWSTLDDRGNMATVDEMVTINQVGAFWAQLYALDQQNLLDRKLAMNLFGYQFHYWREHCKKLVTDTELHDADQPDVIEGLKAGRLDWLTVGRKNLPVHGLGTKHSHPAIQTRDA